MLLDKSGILFCLQIYGSDIIHHFFLISKSRLDNPTETDLYEDSIFILIDCWRYLFSTFIYLFRFIFLFFNITLTVINKIKN